MRLLPVVLLGVSLAAASPIRVIVADVSSTDPGPLNYGLATLHVAPAVAVKSDVGATRRPRPFCQSMRTKALEASEYLRSVLGLDSIITPDGPTVVPYIPHSDGHKQPAPLMPFIGTPVRPTFVADNGNTWRSHGVGHYRHPHPHGSFLRRLHHALMALGPWEGRAIAFVLGCGIGVLLRMLWVIVLVVARAFRSPREEDEYDVVFDEADLLVPPPQYTTIQGPDAVPVVVDDKPEKEPIA